MTILTEESPKKRYNLRKKNKLRKKQYKLAEESDSDSDWLPDEVVAASPSEESGTENSSTEESGSEEGEEAFECSEFSVLYKKYSLQSQVRNAFASWITLIR